jgi:hypothetical protein
MNYSTFRLNRLLTIALAVLAAAAFAACGDDDDGDDAPKPASDQPTIVEPSELSDVADRVGHPIYWVGERDGTDYELSESGAGRVYVRYLDEGTKPGVRSAKFLTVGTYEIKDPVAALRRAAKESPRAELARSEDGAVVLIDPAKPGSVYLAYPGKDQQIEVFSPDVKESLELATSGDVEPIE